MARIGSVRLLTATGISLWSTSTVFNHAATVTPDTLEVFNSVAVESAAFQAAGYAGAGVSALFIVGIINRTKNYLRKTP